MPNKIEYVQTPQGAFQLGDGQFSRWLRERLCREFLIPRDFMDSTTGAAATYTSAVETMPSVDILESLREVREMMQKPRLLGIWFVDEPAAYAEVCQAYIESGLNPYAQSVLDENAGFILKTFTLAQITEHVDSLLAEAAEIESQRDYAGTERMLRDVWPVREHGIWFEFAVDCYNHKRCIRADWIDGKFIFYESPYWLNDALGIGEKAE